MSCTERLEAAILADYWLGLLGADEEERIEEHLFACNECHSRLAEVETMAEGVRALARSGSLLMVGEREVSEPRIRPGPSHSPIRCARRRQRAMYRDRRR